MLEPVPPRVKLGRTTQGRPISCSTRRPSSRLVTVSPRQHSRPIRSMAALNWSRSSALAITCGVGADHLDAVLLQHAVPDQVHGQVQPGLAAERRQQGVGPLGLDHLGHDLPGERLDVRPVGHLRIGHDGGRIGVDQHDLVALFAEGLAGLGARIVELAGLADDDRAGADQQNLVDVVASWHGCFPSAAIGAIPGMSVSRGGGGLCKIP